MLKAATPNSPGADLDHPPNPTTVIAGNTIGPASHRVFNHIAVTRTLSPGPTSLPNPTRSLSLFVCVCNRHPSSVIGGLSPVATNAAAPTVSRGLPLNSGRSASRNCTSASRPSIRTTRTSGPVRGRSTRRRGTNRGFNPSVIRCSSSPAPRHDLPRHLPHHRHQRPPRHVLPRHRRLRPRRRVHRHLIRRRIIFLGRHHPIHLARRNL